MGARVNLIYLVHEILLSRHQLPAPIILMVAPFSGLHSLPLQFDHDDYCRPPCVSGAAATAAPLANYLGRLPPLRVMTGRR